MILAEENRRTRRKTCPSANLSITNPIWIDPGTNPGLRSERPATNDLSHGKARLLLETVKAACSMHYLLEHASNVHLFFILFSEEHTHRNISIHNGIKTSNLGTSSMKPE
jgi:hypothetical protein